MNIITNEGKKKKSLFCYSQKFRFFNIKKIGMPKLTAKIRRFFFFHEFQLYLHILSLDLLYVSDIIASKNVKKKM